MSGYPWRTSCLSQLKTPHLAARVYHVKFEFVLTLLYPGSVFNGVCVPFKEQDSNQDHSKLFHASNMDAGFPDQSDLLTKLLNIHLIFREIVQHLTLPDLIACSAVCREWCVNFRDYIYREESCPIQLVWRDRPCEQLRDLSELLRHSTFLLPFNGLMCPEWSTYENILDTCSAENHADIIILESYAALLSKVRLTSFVISWPYQVPEEIKCPAVRCMDKMMRLNAGRLRRLTLRQSLKGVKSLLDYYNVEISLRPGWLGSLERFTLKATMGSVSPFHVQEILESSPNLKAIHGLFHRNMFERPPPCPGIIPEIKYRYIVQAHGLSAVQLLRLAEARPALKYLSLYSRNCGHTFGYTFETDLEPERGLTLQALNGLFRSSYNSLRRIVCESYHLAVISRGVEPACWPLPNVSSLVLYGKYAELAYLKYINFLHMFPKLVEVTVWPCSFVVPLDYNLLRSGLDLEYRDSTVKILHLYHTIPEECFKILESIFPNLDHFMYHHFEGIPEVCGALWKRSWGQMRTVTFCSIPFNFDVESAFFGLLPEERQLIESQELDPREVHHVSSQYSAFSLNCLKTIQLELVECEDVDGYTAPSPSPSYEIQAMPLISSLTAHRISTEFPRGLEVQLKIEPERIAEGAPISNVEYSSVLRHPGDYKTSCLHKLNNIYRHRLDNLRLKKSKFSIYFPRKY